MCSLDKGPSCSMIDIVSRPSVSWNDIMNHEMFGAQLEHSIFHDVFTLRWFLLSYKPLS